MACGYQMMSYCCGLTTSAFLTISNQPKLIHADIIAGVMCVGIPYPVNAIGLAVPVSTTTWVACAWRIVTRLTRF